MNYVRYRLQPYSGAQSRHRCPACKHRNKTFKRYIHPDTGEPLAYNVGLCDRVLKCGYHYTPKQYFAQTGNAPTAKKGEQRRTPYKPPPPKPTDYMSVEQVNQSLNYYQQNKFVLYLIAKLGVNTADEIVKRYLIGTSNRWPGATVFWQIDVEGKVRTGKIMLYDQATGKRVKKPYNHVTWAHLVRAQREASSKQVNSTQNNSNGQATYSLKQCFFGEHLLVTYPNMPVAIVESEKTAVIASAFMSEFVWIASGSLDGLNTNKCKPLQHRKVMLFPDANGYLKWTIKAGELQKAMPDTLYKVSNILEQIATDTDRLQGIDISDLILEDSIIADRYSTPADGRTP